MGNLLSPFTGGGGSGVNFKAEKANIINPVSQEQASGAYNKSQEALDQQAAFLNQLQMQNGIQNQSNVFNQLQNVASGQGPNPAQAMLANATGANVANQASMMAGQRGAGSNVGMIGRQAAMQGSNAQQQAAGQAAALQAQQSLNALSGMGQMAGQQVGQQAAATTGLNSMTQSQQQMLLNSIAQQNQANVGMQSNINSSNAAIAGETAKGQGNVLGGLMSGAGSAMELFGGGGGAAGGGGGIGGMFGDMLSGLGPAMGNLFGAIGTGAGSALIGGEAAGAGGTTMGVLPAMIMAADGGMIDDKKQLVGPQSRVGQHFHGRVAMAKGGAVPALVSPGEKYLKPSDVQQVKKGANPMSVGEKIPGKPKVAGAKNSYANDTVPKTLQEGGIVLPRSVTQAKNPGKAASDFVAAIMAKQGKGLKK